MLYPLSYESGYVEVSRSGLIRPIRFEARDGAHRLRAVRTEVLTGRS
jgi:hypothetical protein